MMAAMQSQVGTLLVSCPDRKGIVASLAQVLYGHGANILDADQHTDPVAGMFFQRIRFDLATMTTDRVALEHGLAEVAARFAMTHALAYGNRTKRVAILVSKVDHCLFDLLLRHRAGELPCAITAVISNHVDLGPVAAQFGLPFVHLPVTAETRAAQEAALEARCVADGVDLIVLARYMQILSADAIAKYPARIINIHHSFHPAFVGGNP